MPSRARVSQLDQRILRPLSWGFLSEDDTAGGWHVARPVGSMDRRSTLGHDIRDDSRGSRGCRRRRWGRGWGEAAPEGNDLALAPVPQGWRTRPAILTIACPGGFEVEDSDPSSRGMPSDPWSSPVSPCMAGLILWAMGDPMMLMII